MGLETLTGLPASSINFLSDADKWTSDTVWDLAQKADYTPICIGTKAATAMSQLESDTYYTIMTTTQSPQGNSTAT
jgi:hypothetical protein